MIEKDGILMFSRSRPTVPDFGWSTPLLCWWLLVESKSAVIGGTVLSSYYRRQRSDAYWLLYLEGAVGDCDNQIIINKPRPGHDVLASDAVVVGAVVDDSAVLRWRHVMGV